MAAASLGPFVVEVTTVVLLPELLSVNSGRMPRFQRRLPVCGETEMLY
jgi:hypothetical protein